MAISRYSRYLHIQPSRAVKPAITDIIHTFTAFETVDVLAAKYYNDPSLEWVIMAANPSWSFSFEIPPGTPLRIPFPLSRVFNAWGLNSEV